MALTVGEANSVQQRVGAAAALGSGAHAFQAASALDQSHGLAEQVLAVADFDGLFETYLRALQLAPRVDAVAVRELGPHFQKLRPRGHTVPDLHRAVRHHAAPRRVHGHLDTRHDAPDCWGILGDGAALDGMGVGCCGIGAAAGERQKSRHEEKAVAKHG